MIYLYWPLWFSNITKLVFVHLNPWGFYQSKCFHHIDIHPFHTKEFLGKNFSIRFLELDDFPEFLSWSDLGFEKVIKKKKEEKERDLTIV